MVVVEVGVRVRVRGRARAGVRVGIRARVRIKVRARVKGRVRARVRFRIRVRVRQVSCAEPGVVAGDRICARNEAGIAGGHRAHSYGHLGPRVSE